MTTDRPIRDNSTLGVPEHVLARRTEDETVLLNLDNEQFYGLDQVGTRLWQLVETGTTFGEAVATLQAEYDVGREVLATDLVALVLDLQSHGLVLVDAA